MSDFRLPEVEEHDVVVVGDVMLDKYWFGDVDRISPEAPVPIVAVGQEEQRTGGAANVASNVAALGAQTHLVCIVGDDIDADTLTALLESNHVNVDRCVCADHHTTVKLRVIGQQQQLLRADFDRPVPVDCTQAIVTRFEAQLSRADVVILSDYGKGTLAQITQLIDRAKVSRIPVLVDPKGRDFSRYRGATMITPNLAEFEAVVGHCESEAIMHERALTLINELSLQRLLVTQGNQGMTLFEADGTKVHGEAQAREVFDVSGAGDTVIAAMAIAYCGGLSARDALTLANTAAGLVVKRLGTAVVSRDELTASLLAGERQ